jgi:hypothetical protein
LGQNLDALIAGRKQPDTPTRRQSNLDALVSSYAFTEPGADMRAAAGRLLRSRPGAAVLSGFGQIADKLNRLLYGTTAVEAELLPEWKQALQGQARRSAESEWPFRGTPSGVGQFSWLLSPETAAETGALAVANEAAKAGEPGAGGRVVGRLAQAYGRGVRGEDRFYTSDLMNALHGPAPSGFEGVVRAGGSFIADLVKDPFTWANPFQATAKGTLARATGKLAPTLAGQAAAKQLALLTFAGEPVIYGDRVLRPVSALAGRVRSGPVGKGLSTLFSTATKSGAVARALSDYDVAKATGRLGAWRETSSLQDELVALAKAAGKESSIVGPQLLEAVEVGGRKEKAATGLFDALQGKVAASPTAGRKYYHGKAIKSGFLPAAKVDPGDADRAAQAAQAAGAAKSVDELLEEAVGPELIGKGRAFVEKWQQTFAEELMRQRAAGMKVGDWGPGYAPHIFTDEWWGNIEKADAAFPHLKLKDAFFANRDRLLTAPYTVREFNDIMATKGMSGVLPFWPEEANFKIAKALHDDPAYLAARYMTGSVNAVSAKGLMESLTQIPGVTRLKKGGTLPAGYRQVAIPGLDDYYAEPTIAAEIEKHLPHYLSGEERAAAKAWGVLDPVRTEALEKFFDPAQNWWKAWTLAVFPSYHVRNSAGNMWNCFLAGASDPAAFKDAWTVQLAVWEPSTAVGRAFKRYGQKVVGGDLDQIATKYGLESGDDLLIRGDAHRVFNAGWQAAEIPGEATGIEAVRRSRQGIDTWTNPELAAQATTTAAEAAPQYKRLSELPGLGRLSGTRVGQARPGIVFGPQAGAIKGGRTVGTLIENNARVGLWLDQMGKFRAAGAGADDAARAAAMQVKKYLFDYGELTEFEKQAMKRLMPFYTWTRKNIPLQLEELIKQPAKFSGIEKARVGIESAIGPGPDEQYMSENLAERSPLRVSASSPLGIASYQPLEGVLPAVDLGALTSPKRAAFKLLNMLTPFKAPVEAATNYSTFYRGPIHKYGWERDQMFGFDLPSDARYLARQFRPVSEGTYAYQAATGDMPTRAALLRAFIGKTQTYDAFKGMKRASYVAQDEANAAKRAMLDPKNADQFDYYMKIYLDALSRAYR